MSIRKIKTKTGESKWEVRVHSDGRGSKRITRRYDRKSDAESFVMDLKRSYSDPAGSAHYRGSLKEKLFETEAEYWFNSAVMKFSAGHLKRMKGIYKEVLPQFGHLPLEKFTPEFITKFQRSEKEKGLENSTINRKVQIITSILNHSLRHRRINYNPSFGFSKLKESDVEMFFWDRSEAESFLKFADEKYPAQNSSRWVYIVYLTALNTAIRSGELWGLKPIDISEDGLKIVVRRQFNLVTGAMSPTKGNKSRVVPCNAHLDSELRSWIEFNKIRPDETIFMNEARKPINHVNFVKRKFEVDLEEWSQGAQGKRIRFHDLRHTSTTLLIAGGVDIKTVKEICGHQDIKTTMNYVHMVAGTVEKVALNFSVQAATSNAKKEVKQKESA